MPGAAPVDMTAVITPAATDHASATREQLLARLLYRDALMLIIDKPPGLAVPRAPRAAPISRICWTGCASVCRAVRAGPSARSRYQRPPGAQAAPPRAPSARSPVCRRPGRPGPIGPSWRARPGGAAPRHLPLGRQLAERGWWMKVDPPASLRPRTTACSAAQAFTGWSHPLSQAHLAAGAPRRARLPGARRSDLRPRAASRCRGAAATRAPAPSQHHYQSAAHRRRGAAAAHMLDALIACGFDPSSTNPGPRWVWTRRSGVDDRV